MKISLTWLCVLFLLAPIIASDEEQTSNLFVVLHITDGTKIEGNFIGYENGYFIVRTVSSGENKIPQNKVKKITFEHLEKADKAKVNPLPGLFQNRRANRFKMPDAIFFNLRTIFELEPQHLNFALHKALLKPRGEYKALCEYLEDVDDPRYSVLPIWWIRPIAERKGEPGKPMQILKERLRKAERGTQEYMNAQIILGIANLRYEHFNDGKLMLKSALKDTPNVFSSSAEPEEKARSKEIALWLEKVLKNIDEHEDTLKRICLLPPLRVRQIKGPWHRFRPMQNNR